MCRNHRSGAGKVIRWALALCLACGGLAEDGRLPLESFPSDVDLDDTPLSSDEPAALRADSNARQRTAEPSGPAEPVGGAARVGEACGLLGDAATKSTVVGEVELQEDARCGTGNSCLVRAPAAQPCGGFTNSGLAGCAAPEPDEFVPVPPPAARQPAWQAGLCTCRCDGRPSDVDYCACPGNMRCEPIIPSAGANAAARPYVGSYCVF